MSDLAEQVEQAMTLDDTPHGRRTTTFPAPTRPTLDDLHRMRARNETAAASPETAGATRAVEPVVGSVTEAFVELEAAVGDLPFRFIRRARSQAIQLNCRPEWDRIEAALEALRQHIDE